MKKSVSKTDVKRVAQLSKLSFDDQYLAKVTNKFEEIIEMVFTLSEVNTDNVKPTFSVTNRANVLRNDTKVDSHQLDALLKNAPNVKDTLIKVPSILKEVEDN